MAHYYPWFPGDYQRDTLHLSFVEDAAYRRLLDAYYMVGKISAHAENLLRVCRAITPEEQEAVKKVASEFFSEKNGLLVHEKVEKILAKTVATSEIRSEAGKKGAETTNKRRSANTAANAPANDTAIAAANAEILLGKKSSIPEPEPKNVNTYGSPSASESADDGFAAFWALYPKKVAKPAAEKVWRKLKPDGRILSELMAGLERQRDSEQWCKAGGQFVPYPATWLNGRRWEDEAQNETLPASTPAANPVFAGAI